MHPHVELPDSSLLWPQIVSHVLWLQGLAQHCQSDVSCMVTLTCQKPQAVQFVMIIAEGQGKALVPRRSLC